MKSNFLFVASGRKLLNNMFMSEIHEQMQRVEKLLAEKGMKMVDFAKQLGASTQSYNNWRKRGMPGSTLIKAAGILDVSPAWLDTGKIIDAQSVRDASGSYNVRNDPSGDDVLIPQYEDIALAAGHGSYIDNETATNALAFKRTWLNKKGYKENNLVVVFARGDSMSPRISDGDVLLVKTDENHNILDGKVYAINYAGEAKVKRLSKRFDGSVVVSSDNQTGHYRDEIISPEQIEQLNIIGRVVWIGGDM